MAKAPQDRIAAAEAAEARLREAVAEARGLAGDIRRERDRATAAIRAAHLAAADTLKAALAQIREEYGTALQQQYERMLGDTARAAQDATDALGRLAGCDDWPALVELVSARAERLCVQALAGALGGSQHEGEMDQRLAARLMAAYPQHFTGDAVLGLDIPVKLLAQTAAARLEAVVANAHRDDWNRRQP